MTLGNKFINRIKTRFHFQNKNWLAIICGETGSGKSYSSISFAYMIGNVHIVFTPLEFLHVLNHEAQKGDIIIFDEAGVGMSSRDWQSVQNKIMGSVLQTFRHYNIGVIFTTPNLSFVDIQARKLFHNYFETQYIDYDNKECTLKVYDIEVNSMLDKIYYKKPKFVEDGSFTTMARISVPLAPQDVLDDYEKRKKEYTQQLNAKAEEEIMNLGKPKEKRHEVDVDRIAQQIRSSGEKLNVSQIAYKFKLPVYKASIVKNIL